jgi:large subunit ribosomal protein L18
MLEKTKKRLKRKERIRAKISGTATKPRLSVFRSLSHISVQLIDDDARKTLAEASDLKLKKE